MQRIAWSIRRETMEGAAVSSIYVEVKIIWFFERSPANASFYSDLKCEAFSTGKFSDSFTDYHVVPLIGNESISMANFKNDLYERYRDRMAAVSVLRISRADYLDAIEKQKEEWVA